MKMYVLDPELILKSTDKFTPMRFCGIVDWLDNSNLIFYSPQQSTKHPPEWILYSSSTFRIAWPCNKLFEFKTLTICTKVLLLQSL